MHASIKRLIAGTTAAVALGTATVVGTASQAAAAPYYCGSSIQGGVGGNASGGCSGGQGYFRVTVQCSGGGEYSSAWVYRPANAGWVSTTTPGCPGWRWSYPVGSYVSVSD